MDTTTDPTVTLTLPAHLAQNFRLRWMATSARRALAYARALLYVRSDSHREYVSLLPCGAQDGDSERLDGLEYNHKDGLWMVETLTTAIESAGLIPVDSTSCGFGGDIACSHDAAIALLALVKAGGESDQRLREGVDIQQQHLERTIARAGF